MNYFTKTVSTLMVLGLFVSCSNKDKTIPLFMALVGNDGTSGQAQTPSGSNTGVPTPDGSYVETIDDTTVVIHLPQEPTSTGSSPTTGTNTTPVSTTTTGSTSPSNPTPSTSPDSSPSVQPPKDTTSGGEVPPPTTQVTNNNQDQIGEIPFTYQNSNTLPIEIEVKDDNGPVSGAIVTVVDTTDPNTPDILFQQVTNSNGTVSGTITVPTNLDSVQANINLGDKVVSTTIPTHVVDPNTNTQQSVVAIDRDIVVSGTHNPPAHFIDSDGDGIADALDDYPDDPTRATLSRFPKSGVNTLAFEDLYPNAGDADLNDYVLFFNTEEDTNAQGKVVAIRGSFEHVARGAGYRHTLNVKFSVPTGATYSYVKFKNRNNRTVQEESSQIRLTAQQLASGIELLEESSKTISTPNNNAAHANNLKFGDLVNFEIVFDEPVARSAVGSAPYDIFAHVVNTKKDIHLPGRYFDSAGKDLFMDRNGFPWAIIIPGQWKWPLEGLDIRVASKTGYADFQTWALSKGTDKKEWYLNVTDPSKVFPLPDESNLAGFLAKAAEDNWLALSLGLLAVGLSTGYFLTRKNPATLSR